MSKVRSSSDPGTKEESEKRTRCPTSKWIQMQKEVKLKRRDQVVKSLESKWQKVSSCMIEETSLSDKRKWFKEWCTIYERFLEAQEDYESLFEESEEDVKSVELKRQYRHQQSKIQQWIIESEHDTIEDLTPQDSASQVKTVQSGSHVSRRSQVETQVKKAELEAKAKFLKEKREIDQQKLELSYQEEDLHIRSQIASLEAGSRVREELSSVTKHKTKISSNIDRSHRSDENMMHIVRELKKPDNEVRKFDGSHMDYKRFVRQFHTKIENNTSDYNELLTYLEQYTNGVAYKVVSSYSHLDAKVGYKKAWKDLEERYGDPEDIAESYITKALDWPIIKADDVKSLDDFSVFLAECENAVESIDAMKILEFKSNLQKLVKKLPFHLHDKWRSIVLAKKDKKIPLKFQDLVKFIKREAKKATDPTYGKVAMYKDVSQRITPKGKDDKPIKRTSLATIEQEVKPNTTDNYRKTHISSSVRPNSHSKPVKELNQTSKGDKHQANSAANGNIEASKRCLYCYGQLHTIAHCRKLDEKSLEEKLFALRNLSVCFGCLRKGHQRKNCTNVSKCDLCGRRHPTLLHSEEVPRPNPVEAHAYNLQVDVPCDMGVGTEVTDCTLAIVLVKIRMAKSEDHILTYAFLDCGSSISFISSDLMNKLGAQGKRKRITLNTMGQPHTFSTDMVNGLEICDVDENNHVMLPSVYSKYIIPVSKSHIPTKEDISHWCHLKDIEVPEVEADIGLLIGNNIADAYSPLKVVTGPPGSPHATQTRIGWILWNVVRTNAATLKENYEEAIPVNRAEILAIEDDEVLTKVDQAIRNSYNIDFPEHVAEEKREYSQDDKKFLQMVEEATAFQNGHYEIPLPFKSPFPSLPDNSHQALQRLNSVKRRMIKSETFFNDYTDFMKNIIDKDFAEKLEDETSSQNRTWYLCHHGIYHPRKPNKLRIVFDCSARCYGVSLNDLLIQGPDLTNSLIGVLLRFRQERICFMSDVDSMFFAVHLPKEYQDYLRFYWWSDGNIHKEPEVYRMKVHIFGAVSSPSCANYALKRTALDNECSTAAYNTIISNFYVDDCLKSTKSVDEAISLCHELRDVLDRGGFKLRKWISNSRELLESLPVSERAKDVQKINLEYDELPSERALGVYWSVETDTFGFKVLVKSHSNTRRNILSIVSSVYDPLGLISPLILPAKLLLQDLCRIGYDWDQEIAKSQVKKWQQWLTDLLELENVKIPRCFKFPSLENEEIIYSELHNFSDASEKGYGTVSYLRLTNSNGSIYTSLVMSKARVAPLKTITIPRMELTAAMMSVKLSRIIKSELEINIDRTIFWTDSMSVINYINNESTRFRTFVANRISVIRANTDVDQWKYIEGKLNPSDLSSRGATVHKLIESQWFEGPSFLKQPESEWPKSNHQKSNVLDTNDPEVKGSTYVTTGEIMIGMECFIQYFSSWSKLRKMVGWLLKFMSLLQLLVNKRKEFQESTSTSQISQHDVERKMAKFRKNEINTDEFNHITVKDMEDAELVIFKFEQKRYFPGELKSLETKSKVAKHSPIVSLDPVLDSGVIRVGGRLNRSTVKEYVKHPIILPKSSHVSVLIVEETHKLVGHMGRNATLSSLRQKLWILKANTLVRNVIHKCIVCRLYQSKTGVQKMADLPEERLIPDDPPFSRTGMDYFGPFYVKVGRSQVKRYGVLFTCLSIRAIHLEIAHTLNVTSCINALRRFLARRGAVKFIRSDNGSNLVGSEKELRDEIANFNSHKIHDYLLQKDIVWKFNPPTGSHFGGAWERQIRSVRKVLYGVIKETTPHALDDESLLTVFCEVERIVNSRPITCLSNDPDDLSPITPNDLLLLQPNYSMPPGIFDKNDSYVRRRWRQVQFIVNNFWDQWLKQYLPSLQERKLWVNTKRNLQVSDLVLLVDDSQPRGNWLLGRVLETLPDSKGLVRMVKVKTKHSTLIRPISKLCLIMESNKV